MPGQPWGIRSIPEIDSRYPLWDQPNFMRDIDEGRFFLPDAEEGRRETIITSVIDAEPQQCQRLPSSSFITMWAALTTGGFFIFGTFHWWWPALASLVIALAVIIYWLWTGTALIPEKEAKYVGLGLTLPLYVSGPQSVGWWAMFITMLAILAAFVSLIFGYFFFWTVRADFPPKPFPGPGLFWPLVGAALILSRVGADLARAPMESFRQLFPVLLWIVNRCRGGVSRCGGADRGAVVKRSGSEKPRLSGDRVADRALDRGSDWGRSDHAALLRGSQMGRSHDGALRYRHSQRGALLALHRVHSSDRSGGDRRFSIGGVAKQFS